MDIKGLLSGIAVVIDDQLDAGAGGGHGDGDTDRIVEIVERLERELDLPCYTTSMMPPERTWPGLLQAASFVLLDWKLWPTGAPALEDEGIEKNVRFLERAKDYFVPVFIFSNESPEDIESRLPKAIYRRESSGGNFVFIERKASLLSGNSLDFRAVKRWIGENASVYALKTWEQAFHAARKELFSSMYARSPDWPKVFWKAYKDDGVDPSSSLMHLINDSLRGRVVGTGAFEAEILSSSAADVPKGDLRALIGETSFRPQKALLEDEVRCGDLFRLPKGKFLLNLRPDCDCVPRDGTVDEVDLYCVEGKAMRDSELRKKYRGGHFDERVWESIAFSIHEEKSIRFDFRKFRVERFAAIKNQRIGRLLHPYTTRIQQRYALYLQRQGLPRIPEAAVNGPEDSGDRR